MRKRMEMYFVSRIKDNAKVIIRHWEGVIESMTMRKSEEMDEKNKYKFQKLTPVDDVELGLYKDAIDYIFDNPDVVNVAISGAYGAGKSSVIASYKKQRNDLRFVHISLAHFRTSDGENGEEGKETILEGKILNQLIHQIPSKKIPQTNFRVKRKVETKSFFISTILTMLLFLGLLHIFLFEKWNEYILSLSSFWLKNILNPSINDYSLLVSGGLCAIILSIFLFRLVRAQTNNNIFKKVGIQGYEIEIFEKSEESYFDKYLNEVMYLFENAEADVIVFEDMDRFNLSGIFERLHEINTIANVQLKEKNKSPIRFFYLLRDDIFVSKDRTKFFDYIVPVVPVVDSSNSYDQFISHFKEGGIYDLFDNNFLQGLSLYIDDMRILKNIYNEFVIYYNRLNTTELDCNRMLAIIAYKNLFPRDFSDLQLNQGMVFTLFERKDAFIKTDIERLNELANQKISEIENARREHLNSIQELDVVYTARRSSLSSTWQQRNDFEKNYNEEYPVRKLAIENKLNNRLPELEDELSNIEQGIILTQSKQLKEMITRKNIDLIFKVEMTNEIGIETNFHEIKGSEYFDLLKYLIRNGHIDETYPDYMTYFYENSLGRLDKTFLRSITDKKAKEYTYQLKNLKLVTARIREVDFDQEEVLNFDLLQYLLRTPDNVILLNRFLRQLRETKNFKFIGAYFDTERELGSYIRYLNQQWPEIFNIALEGKLLTDKQIRLYSIYTLYYSNDNVQSVNYEDSLTRYISSSTDYLDINEPNVDMLINGFIKLNVSFVGIDQANAELLKEVYGNSLYKINFENLVLMLEKFYSIENEKDFYHKNYTLVLSQPESPLSKHVQINFCDYIDVVLSNSKDMINDEEDVALLILNHKTISTDQKNKYIKLLQTSVTSIVKINDNELWSSLLSTNLVKYSEENIIQYFGYSKKLESELISFINSNESQLDFLEVKNNYGTEKVEKFYVASIVCNELSNNKYKEILISLGYSSEIFDIDGISDEKFRIIVDESIIYMNLESLQFAREHYSHVVLYFIEKNINEYGSIMTSEVFVLDEVVRILSWDVEDDIKTGLLEFTKEPISILNKSYSTALNTHILNNNLDSDDLPYLFITYEKWVNEIRQIVYDLARDGIELIIKKSIRICNKLLSKLFELNDLNKVQKIDLFISSLHHMDEEECKEYLDILNLTEFKKVFEPRTRPKYEISQINEMLLTAFKMNDCIYDFQEDKYRDGHYKIIRNRPGPKQKSLSPDLL